MEAVKVLTQAPQVDMARSAAATRAVRAGSAARDGGGSGEAPTRAAAPSPERADPREMARAAEELAERYNLKVEVAWDDRTGRQVLKVLSPEGDRLLRQFPAEAVLKLAERLRSGSLDGLLTSLV